ncbi:Sensor histidine kinase VanS [Clostridiaceae bacterium JG1575]|nr:Sensor histidine kinase VanS [Clostridiaceae bacterium JG1575]
MSKKSTYYQFIRADVRSLILRQISTALLVFLFTYLILLGLVGLKINSDRTLFLMLFSPRLPILPMIFAFLACVRQQIRFIKQQSAFLNAIRRFVQDPARGVDYEDFSGIRLGLEHLYAHSELSGEKLRMEFQKKNDLITYIAHDIKTPLASIIGYLSLLDESKELPADMRERFTGIALRNALRLDDLITEFFEISKYQLQTLPLHRVMGDVHMLLLQMQEELALLAKDSEKQLKVLPGAPLRAYFDPDQMGRALSNIVTNAIHYSTPKSVVVLQAAAKGSECFIACENEGATLSREEIRLIFEKFNRLDPSRSTKIGGSGLGLSIAREILRSHGGDIQVTSNAGITRFILRFPLAAPAEPSAAKSPSSGGPRPIPFA